MQLLDGFDLAITSSLLALTELVSCPIHALSLPIIYIRSLDFQGNAEKFRK
jgi:hypothetical protein